MDKNNSKNTGKRTTKKRVMVFSTGGTIEKSYSELEGSLENRESTFRKLLLELLRLPHTEVLLREIMAKDSLEMTDEDREVVRRQIEGHFAHEDPIVVLHGTDTMAVTARYCHEKCPDPPVAVIFTGAMRPMGFIASDAPQNIMESLMAAQLARPGYYICFHNHLFRVPNVRKNKSLGTFEEL